MVIPQNMQGSTFLPLWLYLISLILVGGKKNSLILRLDFYCFPWLKILYCRLSCTSSTRILHSHWLNFGTPSILDFLGRDFMMIGFNLYIMSFSQPSLWLRLDFLRRYCINFAILGIIEEDFVFLQFISFLFLVQYFSKFCFTYHLVQHGFDLFSEVKC